MLGSFIFIETKLFSRIVEDYLTDAQYTQVQEALMRKPESGRVVPGSGGVRKLRWGQPGRGKRGGIRIIYYRSSTKSMPKPKRDIGEEILTGIRELKRGESGRIRHLPPIAATRERMGLSQGQFASLLGVSVRTLQEWEQGRRAPSGAARTLILVASRNPKALLDVA